MNKHCKVVKIPKHIKDQLHINKEAGEGFRNSVKPDVETFMFNNIKKTCKALSKLRIFNSYWWKDIWYKIDCYVCPRNEWAHKVIGKQYQDKVSLIPYFLFAAIVNFVDKEEGEDCFGRIDWYNSSKEHRKIANQIKQIYKWSKYDRAAALEKLNNSYPEKPEEMDFLEWVNDNSVPYKVKYRDVIKWEKYIKDRDDKYLLMIVSLREHLWT